ncbi:hypothetical protein ROLI_040310 [Roseobacter fucihabitans]|uniref:Molecular chaperone DnaJ n=1 Tax=Roseobacter fucihabitans TaxID=1537242 RepID=A0ABZ2BYP7_9RHOB
MPDADKSQLDRFKEAAREIGTDDDEAKFNEKLGKLVAREKVKCLACGGTGVMPVEDRKHFQDSEDTTCKNCKGAGEV